MRRLRARGYVRALEPAGSTPADFAFVGCGDPLMLLLPFKAVIFGRAGKSGRPPPLEPSLKVHRDIAHNQSSGFAVAPRVKGLNARRPSKVHPKWRLEEPGLDPCAAGIDRPSFPPIPGSPVGIRRCIVESALCP
jgi:hypothetical protein